MTQPQTDLTAELPYRVMLSQLLWTAGHSLTSGLFLSFFLVELMKPGYVVLAVSVLHATPDVMGISGTLANVFKRIFGDRKRAWIYLTLLSRTLFIIMPLLFLIPKFKYTGRTLVDNTNLPVCLMLSLVACVWFFQSIAYVNLVTWLTELYPKRKWNNLFGKWEFARVGILIFIPGLAAFLKYVGGHLSDYGLVNLTELGFYGIIFVFGCSLQLYSLAPLLKFPAEIYRPIRNEHLIHDSQPKPKASLWELFNNHSIRMTIFGSWWLAFFQGLTQSVLFIHATKTLEVTLEMYVVLNSILYACQGLLCYPSIILMNRIGSRKVYMLSLFIVSFSLVCWFYSSQSNLWPLIIAYMLWGFFAPVNIAGSTLICKLSAEKNQALAFAMFRTVTGVFAGLSGIYGGYLLGTFSSSSVFLGFHLVQLQSLGFTPVQLVILISFLGRITAPLWLIQVQEPMLASNPNHQVHEESPV